MRKKSKVNDIPYQSEVNSILATRLVAAKEYEYCFNCEKDDCEGDCKEYREYCRSLRRKSCGERN